MRTLTIVTIVVASITAALTETLYCSTWQGIHTCSSLDGYVGHETQWQGLTTGDDNQGNRWSTSRWLGTDITTVRPPNR